MSTIFTAQDASSSIGISGGGLIVSGSGFAEGARANNSQYKGKYYFEVATTWGGTNSGVGLGSVAATLPTVMTTTGTANAAVLRKDGSCYINGANVLNFGASPSNVDFAVDLDNHKIWFRKDNGNWNNDVAADPATNTNGFAISTIDKTGLFPVAGADNAANSFTFNFTSASRSVPSGFTTGWPDPSTISLDGAATKSAIQSGGSSITSLNSLRTSGVNRILLAAVTLEKSGGAPTVTGVTDTAGLTWSLRKRFQFGASNGLCVELWWALAATQITSPDTITFALSGTVDDSSVATTAVFGQNLNTTSPFDADVTLPATATGSSTSPAVSSFAVDEEALVIALFGAGLTTAGTGNAPAGTESSLIANARNNGGVNFSFLTMEGSFKLAAASGLSATTGAITSTTWGMVADAIKAGSAVADLFATIADDTGLAATIKVTTPCNWNPSNKGSSVALSNGNLTMTVPSGSGSEGGVTGTVGNNKGKKYFELTVSNISSLAQFNNWGVVSAPTSVELNFARVDASAYKGTFRQGIYGGGGHFDEGGPITIGVEVDFTTAKVYANYVGGSFGAGTGFLLVAELDFGKTYFPWAFDTGETGDGSSTPGAAAIVTANFGVSAFALGLPSGYASWDTLQGSDGAAPALPTTYFIWTNGLDIQSDMLTLVQPTAGNSGAVAYSARYSGKYYFEATWSVLTGLDGFGIAGAATDVTQFDHGAFTYFNNGDARAYNGAGGNIIFDAGFSAHQAVGCAADLDNWLLWWYNPGSGKWNNSTTANPETGVGGFDISAIKDMGVWPTVTIQGGLGDTVTFNFGSTTYAHTAPAGFGPWYKNDNALQMEFGDRASIALSSLAANTAYNSGTTQSQGTNRTIVVDVVAAVSGTAAPLGYKITDSAGLSWHKRQDIYDSLTGFHFIRFWARAAAQLSGWHFTITTPSIAPGELLATARIFAGADTDPWDSGIPTAQWNDDATGAPINGPTVHPVSEEIIVLSSVVLGGTGFDAALVSGGIEFEVQNIATFIKEHSAGHYYSAGVGSAGLAFSWTMGAHPNALAMSTDALRADTFGPGTLWLDPTFTDEALLSVAGQLTAIVITDDGGLTARLGMTADIADDLGLTATIRVANPGDLQSTIVDDGGLSASMTELDIATFPQVVVIAC